VRFAEGGNGEQGAKSIAGHVENSNQGRVISLTRPAVARFDRPTCEKGDRSYLGRLLK
jgi:hypothetical protein